MGWDILLFHDILKECEIFLRYRKKSDTLYLKQKRNGDYSEMEISYNKLWKMLIDQNINKSDLRDRAGISFNVIAKMGKGEAVSMESLQKICKALNCNGGDIVEFINVQ